MGQKVHPLGFRVGITKKHQSQWFARFNKNKYAQSVLEDKMLRQTLTKLFPQLLNPVLKKVQKRDEESLIIPRITQIKIERGLIPYEIGIQIHAENCELIKTSIENLNIKNNKDLVSKLQKTRHYLQYLKLKINLTQTCENLNIQEKKNDQVLPSKFTHTLTKKQLRRKRLILKRLKKRQLIRRSYYLYKGFFLSLPSKQANFVKINKNFKSKKLKKHNSVTTVATLIKTASLLYPKGSIAKKSTNATAIFKARIKKKFVSIFLKRINKKFLQALKTSLFETQKFTDAQRVQGVPSNTRSLTRQATNKALDGSNEPKISVLRLNNKWNFIEGATNYALGKKTIEQKCLKQMELLRKDYITYGTITKAASFRYYQMLTYLKNGKPIKKRKNALINGKPINYGNNLRLNSKGQHLQENTKNFIVNTYTHNYMTNLAPQQKIYPNRYNVLSKKLNNAYTFENECRKIQFIEYLKQLVKKHRSENLFLYLSTISEARKDLRKLKQFTKQHASFLFGLNKKNSIGQEKFTEQVKNILEKNNKFYTSSDFNMFTVPLGQYNMLQNTLDNKNSENVLNINTSANDQTQRLAKANAETPLDNRATLYGPNPISKTFQDIFLEQIEKQRNMYKDNAQLTPKIAIKFYSVNSKNVKAKASFVADSVVDALEKRKAFRKVIKDAKEELIRTPGVKGVKIQVSGRLNGAEIARSEWIRAGRVPLQTLRANLDYSYKTANTIYGIIGVKVWIFKGYTKVF